MKRIMRFLALVLLVVLFNCSESKRPIVGETPFQKRMNNEFKDASISPLKTKDLKRFKSLDFFPVDSSFVVKAVLKRTPDTPWFMMATNTERLTKERVYGILEFTLKNKPVQLNVYQSAEYVDSDDMRDYLFLPFLDLTNGESTYAGGRYLDLSIPKGDTLKLDFNKAYNPYCAYNEKFSCPVVPRENFIELPVTAGVKAFKK